MFGVLVTSGERSENPADLLSSPKRAQRLPHVLKPGEVGALLDRIPATRPIDLRDRAMFELAYASGLRAEELIGLDIADVDFDGETVRVEGKGGKTRLVPAGEPALRAVERYLQAGRPTLAERARGRRRPRPGRPLLLSKSGRRLSTSDVRRRHADLVTAGRAGDTGAVGRASPRTAPFVRHPPARGRRRPALHPGTARPREHFDDAGLHSSRV